MARTEVIEYKCDVCGKIIRVENNPLEFGEIPIKAIEMPIKGYDCEGRDFTRRMGNVDMCKECFHNYWEYVQSRYDASDYYGIKVKGVQGMFPKDELINAIKEYLKDLIDHGQYTVDVLDFNVDIQNMIENLYSTNGWTPVDEGIPTDDRYILISLANFSVPIIGRYEGDENGGNFYAGDEDISLLSQDMIVNAWMELPERYKED